MSPGAPAKSICEVEEGQTAAEMPRLVVGRQGLPADSHRRAGTVQARRVLARHRRHIGSARDFEPGVPPQMLRGSRLYSTLHKTERFRQRAKCASTDRCACGAQEGRRASYGKSIDSLSCSSRSIDLRGLWRPTSPFQSSRNLRRRRFSFTVCKDLAWLSSSCI